MPRKKVAAFSISNPDVLRGKTDKRKKNTSNPRHYSETNRIEVQLYRSLVEASPDALILTEIGRASCRERV